MVEVGHWEDREEHEAEAAGSKYTCVSLVYAWMKSPSCLEITTARASDGNVLLGFCTKRQ